MATDSIKIVYTFVDKSSSGISSAVSGLASLGAAGARIAATGLATATAAMAAAGIAAIKLGSDAEEMQGKFNVVFANVGGEVTRQLDQFASEVGRSRFELMEMASTFGDTLKPMGFAEDAAGEMSVTLSKLATDLGSFNNMSMDEALQRLQSTLIGNHENALAFGVIINQNTLEQELMAMGADKLTGSLLEQAKVQARINLLTRGTSDAAGDAARTAGSFANQMRALQSTIFDAGTEIGLSLLPMVTPLVAKLGELAQLGAAKLVPVFEDIGGAFEAFFTMQSKGFAITDNMETLFVKLARALGLNEEWWGRAGDAFGGFISQVQNGDSILSAAGGSLFKFFDDGESGVTNFGEALGSFLFQLADGQGTIEAAAGSFGKLLTPEQVQKVETANGRWYDLLVTMDRVPEVGEAIKEMWTGVFEVGTQMAALLAREVNPEFTLFKEAVARLFTSFSDLMEQLGIFETKAGTDVVKAAGGAEESVDGFKNAVDFLVGSMKLGIEIGTMFINMIAGVIENISTAMQKIGEFKTAAEGMANALPSSGGGGRGAAGVRDTTSGAASGGGMGGGSVPDAQQKGGARGKAGGVDAGGVGSPSRGGQSSSSNITGSNNTVNNNVTITTNASASTLSNDLNMMSAMAGGI